MARLVFFNLPAYGHVNPTLKLVKALILEGEEVIYYNSESFREKIEQTGATFRPYPVEFDIDLVTISQNIFRSARMLMDYAHRVLPLLLPEVERLKPDYVMHDSLCIWGKVIAKHLNVPGIGSSAILQASVAGGAYKWPLANLMWGMLWQGKGSLIPFFYQSWRLMRKYNMPFYYVPHTYINQEALNLLYTSALLHPNAKKLGDDYLLIGPPGSPPVEDSPFPIKKLEGKKSIYISLGTVNSANQVRFYKMCFEALKDLDAVIVLSTGAFKDLSKLSPIPENFIVRTFAPQALLMKHIDVFVTHGGMNSVHDGLSHEVPLLVIPQTFEQTLNALIVQDGGVGVMLRPDKEVITAEKIRQNVDNLLVSSEYPHKLAKMKESFEESGGISKALEAIFSLVRQDSLI